MLPIIIRSFEPCDQNAARQLILTGLGEHFGFIDETRNPDLDDIVTRYIEAGHTFVVAEIRTELVGTGAVITECEDTGRLVRMSVNRKHRRKGIGRALVTYLLDIARCEPLGPIRNAWDYAIVASSTSQRLLIWPETGNPDRDSR